MEINKIIEDMETFIQFFEARSGAAPVCMLEAIKLLKPYNAGNKPELEQAIKNKAVELRALLQAVGADYGVFRVGMDNAHVTLYSDFDVFDEPNVVVSGAYYDTKADPEWALVCDADGWLFNWEEV